jgi:hypothetical protein
VTTATGSFDIKTQEDADQMISMINAMKGFLHKKPGEPTEAALWFHRDVAGPAMEVETIRGIHDLKAIRDDLDRWRIVTVLREASLASLAAGRTP